MLHEAPFVIVPKLFEVKPTINPLGVTTRSNKSCSGQLVGKDMLSFTEVSNRIIRTNIGSSISTFRSSFSVHASTYLTSSPLGSRSLTVHYPNYLFSLRLCRHFLAAIFVAATSRVSLLDVKSVVYFIFRFLSHS